MAAFDTAELLADIRDRGGLPAPDLRFSDAKLLSAASLELRDVIIPMMIAAQADRSVQAYSLTLVPGQAEYRLPPRAVAGRWQALALVLPTGTAAPLTRLNSEDFGRYLSTQQGQPSGFYVKDYRVVLVPTPNTALTLSLPYYQRPGTLVLPGAAGTVVSVSGNQVYLAATAPAAFTANTLYDVVRGTPGFETLAMDMKAVTVTGSVLTFATAPPAEMVPGDVVALAGQSPFPQCPVEVRGLLAVRAARRAIKSTDEGQQTAMLDSDVAELTQVAQQLLAPRVDGAPKTWGSISRGVLSGLL